ncbi:MAG: hypothetical protein WCO69_06075 [Candidatus Omnitrophota bacterium]
MFNRSFGLLIISVLLLPVTSFAAIEKALPLTDVDIKAMNIKDLTVRESTLWGLEIYRKGEYVEAVKVFQSILRKDCTNRLAQYHLQKIMQKGPDFAFLKDYLNKLPCEKYNFSEEDFLPASFYMEKDTDLMLQQLEAYNKRYITNKAELTAKIAEYKILAERLEQQVTDMTRALEANKKMGADAVAELKQKLDLANKDAKQTADQVGTLKKKLAEEAARAQEAREAAVTVTTAVVKAQTVTAVPQEPSAAEELTTLQAKFADIQKRLLRIEGAVIEKNNQIQNIRKDLDAVKQ